MVSQALRPNGKAFLIGSRAAEWSTSAQVRLGPVDVQNLVLAEPKCLIVSRTPEYCDNGLNEPDSKAACRGPVRRAA